MFNKLTEVWRLVRLKVQVEEIYIENNLLCRLTIQFFKPIHLKKDKENKEINQLLFLKLIEKEVPCINLKYPNLYIIP